MTYIEFFSNKAIFNLLSELSETKFLLSNIINSMSEFYLLLDRGKNIQATNPYTLSLLGYKKYELINNSYGLIFTRESYEKIRESIDSLLEEEKSGIDFEAIVRTKEGKEIPLILSVSKMWNKYNETESIILIGKDISERKRVEEALKEYSERLEERTKKLEETQEELVRKEKLAAIGLLAGGVGHELRNPLGVISNSAYYLNRKLKDADEKVRKHLNILRKEVERSNAIISQLLDFSLMQPPSLVKGDVNSILKDVLAEIKLPENISLEWQPDENLPRVRLDPDQIGRVCQNIISNAIRAMAEGGKLALKTRTRADFIEIIFQDSGKGIPEENLEKIFEPLFSTRAKGIGFGLAIVKSLVEGHKGKIEVESEVGKGTKFTVKLPVDYRIG